MHAFPARQRGKISPCLPVCAELVIALALVRIGEDGVAYTSLNFSSAVASPGLTSG